MQFIKQAIVITKLRLFRELKVVKKPHACHAKRILDF